MEAPISTENCARTHIGLKVSLSQFSLQGVTSLRLNPMGSVCELLISVSCEGAILFFSWWFEPFLASCQLPCKCCLRPFLGSTFFGCIDAVLGHFLLSGSTLKDRVVP